MCRASTLSSGPRRWVTSPKAMMRDGARSGSSARTSRYTRRCSVLRHRRRHSMSLPTSGRGRFSSTTSSFGNSSSIVTRPRRARSSRACRRLCRPRSASEMRPHPATRWSEASPTCGRGSRRACRWGGVVDSRTTSMTCLQAGCGARHRYRGAATNRAGVRGDASSHIGAAWVLDLIEFASDAEVPDAIYRSRPIRLLNHAFADV